MALNFDFTEMKNRLGQEEYDRITDSPFEKGKWHPVTDGLIWMSMAVGLGGITEKNVDKWIERALIYQAVTDPYLITASGMVMITSDDIRNHIGMWTNVSNESDAKFRAKIMRAALANGQRKERLQEGSAFDVLNKRATAQEGEDT